ncbi:MAG: ATP-binding protein [Oligoflexales bacterium]
MRKKRSLWIYAFFGAAMSIFFSSIIITSLATPEDHHYIEIIKTNINIIIPLIILFFIFCIIGVFIGKKKERIYSLLSVKKEPTSQIIKEMYKNKKISHMHNNLPTSLHLSINISAIIIFGLSLSSYTFIFMHKKEKENLEKIMEEKIKTTSMLVRMKINNNLTNIDRIALRFNNEDKDSLSKWKKDTKKYLNDFNNLQSISWVDTDFISHWLYPENKIAIIEQINSISHKEKNTAIHASHKTQKGSISPPFSGPKDETFFLSSHPTFNKKNEINGYIIATYKSEYFFKDLFEKEFNTTILLDSKTIYKQGDHSPKKFDTKIGIHIRNIQLSLQLGPTRQIIKNHLMKSETYTIPGLLIFITIIIVMFYISQTISKNELQISLKKSHEKKIAIDEISIYAQTDKKGIITEVNDKFIEISGYSNEELIGSDHRILNSHHHDRDFFPRLWKEISSKKIWRGEIKNKKKSGEFYWVDTSIIPQVGEDGSISGYIAIRTDITEKKQHEKALLEAKKTAEKSTEIKSQFLANMSHEIRTPLNGILGITDLILNSETDEKTLNKVKSIHKCGETLTQVIDDILDFSKLESNKVQLENISFCIKTEFQQVIDLLKNKASVKGNIIKFDVHKDVPHWISGDPVRVRQIFTNLLSNAIKFTKRGTIKIDVFWDHTQYIKVLVQDNGLGISPQIQSHLFQPFSQADASTTRNFGGSGLGLSICKSFIELMKGSIWVQSSEGKGSTFGFQFPTFPSTKAIDNIQNILSQELIHSRCFQVLVAEDNLINQAVIQGYLEKINCVVHFAENGFIAFQRSQEKNYDIIFMDCHMPIMDGFEATQRIKEQRPDTLIVALTASSMPEDKEKCLNTGMDLFLSKPIQKRNLYQIFEELNQKNET